MPFIPFDLWSRVGRIVVYAVTIAEWMVPISTSVFPVGHAKGVGSLQVHCIYLYLSFYILI